MSRFLILSCAFLRLFPTVSVLTVTSNPQSSAPVPLPKKTRNLFGRHSQMMIISPYLINIFDHHFRCDRHGSYRGQCRANSPSSGRTRERRPNSSKTIKDCHHCYFSSDARGARYELTASLDIHSDTCAPGVSRHHNRVSNLSPHDLDRQSHPAPQQRYQAHQSPCNPAARAPRHWREAATRQ